MKPRKLNLQKALLIVDVQNDFCPGGALPVPQGDRIVPTVNKYIRLFSRQKLPIFASRDWHPKKTRHFQQYGGIWPRHCLQGSKGAQFHPGLKLPKETIVISKGMDPQRDSYSAFDGEDKSGTTLINLLKILGIKEVYVCGLATDYCVKSTTLDALKAGFKVRLLIDAIKGVDIKAGDVEAAVQEMLTRGAKKLTLKEIFEV